VTTTGARHLALVGPTASGKSALAQRAAELLGDVEIVSLDSMQVYREMDVGTAKPTAEMRARVPHHLVDVADPGEEWSVVRTQAGARAAIESIEACGRRALLVGGTGLYVHAVVDGLTVPGADPPRRAALEAATADAAGLAEAYRELERVDPVAASRIEPGNRRRIVRALEVIGATGRPFSSFGPGLGHHGEPALPVRLAGIWLARDATAPRIAGRFARMRDGGLVEEVRRLAQRPGGLSRTAAQAIGYREVLAALAGECTLDAALDAAVRRTVAFARRQRAWFRRDPRITWIGRAGNPEALLPALLATWGVPTPAAPTGVR